MSGTVPPPPVPSGTNTSLPSSASPAVLQSISSSRTQYWPNLRNNKTTTTFQSDSFQVLYPNCRTVFQFIWKSTIQRKLLRIRRKLDLLKLHRRQFDFFLKHEEHAVAAWTHSCSTQIFIIIIINIIVILGISSTYTSLKQHRRRWLGHVLRMDNGRLSNSRTSWMASLLRASDQLDRLSHLVLQECTQVRSRSAWHSC